MVRFVFFCFFRVGFARFRVQAPKIKLCLSFGGLGFRFVLGWHQKPVRMLYLAMLFGFLDPGIHRALKTRHLHSPNKVLSTHFRAPNTHYLWI